MNKNPKEKRCGGFTLAELLIVVAILGVLAAVAVPAFAGTLEKSRETVCLNNRIVLQRHLMYDLMGDGKKEPTPDSLKAYMESDKAECPGGGVYSLKYNKATGSVSVSCSKHDPGGLTNQDMAQKSMDDFIKSYTGAGDQKAILQAYNKYIKEHNAGKPYAVSQEEVLSLFPDAAGGKSPSFHDTEDEEDLIWMPVRLYWDGSPHDVVMATSESIANHASNNPCKGYLICYNGTYYRTNAMNYNKTAYSASYLTMPPKESDKYSDLDSLMADKGWVKVEK